MKKFNKMSSWTSHQRIIKMFFMSLFGVTSVFASQVTLLLVRHGETEWNVHKRMQGHTDISLNEHGLKQAKAVAQRLSQEHPDIQNVYTSDLKRAYFTGLELAELLNVPIQTSLALRERNYGIVEGMLLTEIDRDYQEQREALREKYPNKRDRWEQTLFPGSETIAQVIVRIKAELTRIAKNHPNQKIAVVSHAGAIRSFVAEIKDFDVELFMVPNCGVVEVVYDLEENHFFVKL